MSKEFGSKVVVQTETKPRATVDELIRAVPK